MAHPKPSSKHRLTLSATSITSLNSNTEPATPPDYKSLSIWNTGTLDLDPSVLYQIGTGYQHKRQGSTSLMLLPTPTGLSSPITLTSLETKFGGMSLHVPAPTQLSLDSDFMGTLSPQHGGPNPAQPGGYPLSQGYRRHSFLQEASRTGLREFRDVPQGFYGSEAQFTPLGLPLETPLLGVSASAPHMADVSVLFGGPGVLVTPLARKCDKEFISRLNLRPFPLLVDEYGALAKDQHGCRFLQKKIDENPAVNFNLVFAAIHPQMYEMIIDPFGNYLVQKLIGFCDRSQIDSMVERLGGHLFQISINQYGTRALQKIIDCLGTEHQISLIIQGLSPYVVDLIKDLNGNHVIQKCLNKFSTTHCQFIYTAIAANIPTVATHKHGCCVLQKCLNHIDNDTQLAPLATQIIAHTQSLIKDQFGNYVIQYLMSLNKLALNAQIYHRIEHLMEELCVQKFSSNVVEKLLKICRLNETTSDQTQAAPVSEKMDGPGEEMLAILRVLDGPHGPPPIYSFAQLKTHLIYRIMASPSLNKFVNDPFGNYVIQTLIDVVPTSAQSVIVRRYFTNCKILTPFGKRIQAKINTILNPSLLSMNTNGEILFKQGGAPSSGWNSARNLTGPQLYPSPYDGGGFPLHASPYESSTNLLFDHRAPQTYATRNVPRNAPRNTPRTIPSPSMHNPTPASYRHAPDFLQHHPSQTPVNFNPHADRFVPRRETPAYPSSHPPPCW